MNNENEIERMESILSRCIAVTQTYKLLDKHKTAKNLVNAGIGDKKQAVKEAFNLAKCYLHSNPNLDSELVKISIDRELDNLITELYGADDQ